MFNKKITLGFLLAFSQWVRTLILVHSQAIIYAHIPIFGKFFSSISDFQNKWKDSIKKLRIIKTASIFFKNFKMIPQ